MSRMILCESLAGLSTAVFSKFSVIDERNGVSQVKKKVYVENGVKISFHTFPEERKLFMKWIVAIRRDIRQTFPSDNAHKSLLETFQAIGLSSFTYGA